MGHDSHCPAVHPPIPSGCRRLQTWRYLYGSNLVSWEVRAERMEMQNTCAEIKIRAERRAGEILLEMPKATGGGDKKSDQRLHRATTDHPSLKSLGIEKTESHRWQTIAGMPEAKRAKMIAETGRETNPLRARAREVNRITKA